jgi:hypothetical protein
MTESLQNLHTFGKIAGDFSSGKKLRQFDESEYDLSDRKYYEESRILMDKLENLKEQIQEDTLKYSSSGL